MPLELLVIMLIITEQSNCHAAQMFYSVRWPPAASTASTASTEAAHQVDRAVEQPLQQLHADRTMMSSYGIMAAIENEFPHPTFLAGLGGGIGTRYSNACT
jgi:hypothetical protein